MTSRFQKKSAPKIPAIQGTKPSLFNYQLLTSTGEIKHASFLAYLDFIFDFKSNV